MKLFDRSVDLAQFSYDTPLYPVCRAWIRNLSQLPASTEQASSNEPPDESQVKLLINDCLQHEITPDQQLIELAGRFDTC